MTKLSEELNDMDQGSFWDKWKIYERVLSG